MSKARNGNRKCPNCKHFCAAHGFEIGTDRRPCVVPNCHCVSLEKGWLESLPEGVTIEVTTEDNLKPGQTGGRLMTEDDWLRVERIRLEAMTGQGRLLTEEEEDLCRNAYKEDGPRYINIGVALRKEYARFLRGG